MDLYQFHVTIPKGVTTLHAHLDCIVTARVSQKLAVLEWEKLLLVSGQYAGARDSHPALIEGSGRLGHRHCACAGRLGAYPVPAAGATTQFAATNVEQLEDSPIITGQYFHEFPLAPTITPKHFIDVVADRPEDCESAAGHFGRIWRTWCARPTRFTHRTTTTSTTFCSRSLMWPAWEGLEHGQSSDNGVAGKGLCRRCAPVAVPRPICCRTSLRTHGTASTVGQWALSAGLCHRAAGRAAMGLRGHDAVSWPGAGGAIWAGDPGAVSRSCWPVRGECWITRPGASGAQQKTRQLPPACCAKEAGRGQTGGAARTTTRKAYLLWLDADTLIRKMTGNKKSLDDFEKIFLGKGGTRGR